MPQPAAVSPLADVGRVEQSEQLGFAVALSAVEIYLLVHHSAGLVVAIEMLVGESVEISGDQRRYDTQQVVMIVLAVAPADDQREIICSVSVGEKVRVTHAGLQMAVSTCLGIFLQIAVL